MNKETLEIERYPDHISGYSRSTYLEENSQEILDKLIEWSKDKVEKIYKHKIRHVEENRSNERFYFFDGGMGRCPKAKIPYCDLVCYLDIYYQ
jgi:hypothetical protein